MGRHIQNVTLAGATALVALVAVEGLLRVAPGLLPEETQLRLHWAELTTDSTVSTGDPYLGFRYPPSYHGAIDRGDTHFSYHTDEQGFRNSSPWPDSAAVVILGDSQAFGYGVEDEEAWARLLGGRFGPVVNLGLIGGAPQQYTRILERLGLGLSPRVVLYCLFPGNDVADARLFEAWEKAGARGNYDVWRFLRGRPPESRRLFARLVDESYLVALVRSVRGNLGLRLAGRTVELEDGSALRLAPGVYMPRVRNAQPDSPHFQRVMESIERARALAEGAGSAFVVVLVPTKEEVYLPVYGDPTPELVKPFVAELERRRISHLDLTPNFQRGARAGEALFFEIDGHPNARGNRLMADTVASYLERNAENLGLR